MRENSLNDNKDHNDECSQCVDCKHNFCERVNSWNVFAFGQFTALCLAINSAAASTIGSYFKLRIPVSQTGLAYFILSFHLLWLPIPPNNNKEEEGEEEKQNGFSSDILNRGLITGNDCNTKTLDPIRKEEDGIFYLSFCSWKIRLKKPLWMYFLAAFLDVQANYLFVMSFQYTSITSASLLSSMCVPATMLTSKVLLKRIFVHWHFIGVGVCLLGATLMVWSDIHPDSNNNSDLKNNENNLYAHAYWGDILAISGAFLYGFNDTIAEYFVRIQNDNTSHEYDTGNERIEYLAMLGFFGTLISIVQSYLVGEWADFWTLISRFQFDLLYFSLIWYAVTLAIFYISVSVFLQISESTLLTLSLQTADMWATLFSIFGMGHHIPSILFFVAALLEISGVGLYELFGNSGGDSSQNEKQESLSSYFQGFCWFFQCKEYPSDHKVNSEKMDIMTLSLQSKASSSELLSYGAV